MPPQGIVRELELVAAPDQHAECAIARPVVVRRIGKPVFEQVQRRLKLVAGPELGQRRGHQLGSDAQLGEPAFDALGPPAVQRTPVGCEAHREARVVEIALLAQRVDRFGRRRLRDPARVQMRPDLGDRAIAPAEVTVGQAECALELLGAQAACSSIAASGSASATGRSASIAFTASRSMPRLS